MRFIITGDISTWNIKDFNINKFNTNRNNHFSIEEKLEWIIKKNLNKD